MKKLFASTSLCIGMLFLQTASHASDRDDFYSVILSAPQKFEQSISKASSGKHIDRVIVSNQSTSGLKAMVTQVANQNGVPAHIAHGVIMAESRYNCKAYNRSGAAGIMQILPSTARSVGIHGSLQNCATGLQAGMKYLKLALNKGGYGCSGVSLYEKGVYARPSCTAYGRKVMAYAQNA